MLDWKQILKQVAKKVVRRKPNWAIGIYLGDSPLALHPPIDRPNPVLTAKNVTDVAADFVADPFMLRVNGLWYLFFEVFNAQQQRGEIGLATSPDGLVWHYQQIVLRETFHLSYPYVFQVGEDYFMIPETYENQSIRLYRASQFPNQWEFVAYLLQGQEYVDASIVYYQDYWWLFSSLPSSDILQLHFARQLTGTWFAHPQSPVIAGNAQIARPGGRVISYGSHLIRYAQDDATVYGKSVSAFQITELTPSTYQEQPAAAPILQATSQGWNGLGMHHLDPHLLENGQWMACVDGYYESFVLRKWV